MNILPIKIDRLSTPKDDLLEKISNADFSLQENDVVVISSKVVSIWQGRCVKKDSVESRDDLIMKESDYYLSRDLVPGGHVMHTIKNGVLMASAGIDSSNSGEYYVLWPEDSFGAANELLRWFKGVYKIENLFLIISDSRSLPLRRGTVGFALSWAGFNPVYDYRGKKDLFDKELLVSVANIGDAIASAANLVMGEGSESSPMAIIRDLSYVKEGVWSDETLVVSREDDLYGPFINGVPWQRGGG